MPRIVLFFIHILIRAYFFIGRWLYHFRVEGAENIPSQGPYILSSNEIGEMGNTFTSVFIGDLVLRGKIQNLIGFADEYNWTTVWAKIYEASGTRPVLPHGRGLATTALLQELNALREGKIVIMNPEGEMSWDGRLVPLKPAVAWVALRTAVPIVLVVATQGAYDLFPKWAKKAHWTGNFKVRVGKPFRLTETPCGRVSHEMIDQANRRIAFEMETLIYN